MAMASSRLPREIAQERKMKDFRKANGEEQWPVKKFKDYNFTTLNTRISEVLMEVKRDLEFRQPPKISGNPLYKNVGRYCDFHEQIGYYAEGCIALRSFITGTICDIF
jgi:hypothetical protein